MGRPAWILITAHSTRSRAGYIIGHQRLLSAGFTSEGLTYYNTYPTSISGTYTDSSNTFNYTLSSTGIRIGYGTAGYPAIEVAGYPGIPLQQ